MKIFVILPILCLTMSLVSFGSQESFGDQLNWRLGDGLKKGDYFEYVICHVDYEDCKNFEFWFWIQGDKQVASETRWNSKMVVLDGSKAIMGNMELGKILPEPIIGNSELSVYRKAFKASITSLATFDDADTWSMGPRIAFSYNNNTEKIITHAGTFDARVISWKIDNQTSRVWVVEDFPFPVKAKAFDRAFNGTNPMMYEFELLFHKENVLEDPFKLVHPSPITIESDFIKYPPSPLKQHKTGVSFDEIQCKQNLILVQKYDGTPACVTESTKTKLIERGWTSSSTTVMINSSFEQDHDRTYTNPRNAVIDLEKNNSVTWVNNADYIVQVYDYENKSWSTGQIEPSMRDSIQFNSTGYYEFAVESANDRHFGEIIVISDDTNSLPIETRMKMGMSIVSNDLEKNPALIGVGIGDVNDGIVIDINQKELEKRDAAQSYYYDMYKEMIPFNVPITIEFTEPFKLLE